MKQILLILLITGLLPLTSSATVLGERIKFPTKISKELLKPSLRMGDWNSSGDPVPPYDPPYRFAYDCQAQLSDGVERHSEGRPYTLYMIADFILDNEHTWIESKNLRWFGQRFFDTEEIEDTDENPGFNVKGHDILLRPYFGGSQELDTFELATFISQRFGDWTFSADNELAFMRSRDRIELMTELSVRSRGQRVPAIFMRVLCERKE